MTESVRLILQIALKVMGAEGLCNEECGCGLDELAPCNCLDLDGCVPAKRVKPNQGDPDCPDDYFVVMVGP